MNKTAIEYTEYTINDRTFRVSGPALVGTVSRSKCTIKRIFTYPEAHSKTPFVQVIYDDGYIGTMSISELINIVDDVYQEQRVEESGPAGWNTLHLPTNRAGGIDFNQIDAVLDAQLDYEHQRTLDEIASMDDELAATGRM